MDNKEKWGSKIDDCIKNAIKLAIEENRVVSFVHNNKEYNIDPDEMYDFIRRCKFKENL
jgi:hypothetical protein